ncbi:MAG: hypothetical protein EAZ61_04860 [Oscillatoriales cyanobacterium]|nr:MAG: hypothetical protein EAZ61_04860 [Oscillatoriales cyanobacterium]
MAAPQAIAAPPPSGPTLLSPAYDCSLGIVSGTVDCEGAFAGNNSNQTIDTLFGIDWNDNEILKAEDSTGWFDGDLSIGGGGATSGTWTLSQAFVDAYDSLMFVIKGGTSYSAYLWDGTSTSGTWNTNGIVNSAGRNPGISHFSVYGVACTENCGPDTDVPEPGLAIGLGAMALGAIKARKRG